MHFLDRSTYGNEENENSGSYVNGVDRVLDLRRSETHEQTNPGLTDQVLDELPPKIKKIVYAILIIVGACVDAFYSFRRWRRRTTQKPKMKP